MSTQGFEVTVHNSLTSPILMGGVPRGFALFNGTIAGAFALGLHSFGILPICLLLHVVGVVLTKRDPFFFQILTRHIKQKSFYNV